MRCRVRPKKGTSCIHHSAVCAAKNVRRGRARFCHASDASGELQRWSEAPRSEAARACRQTRRRSGAPRATGASGFRATVEDLGCGRKSRSAGSKHCQTAIDLVGLAGVGVEQVLEEWVGGARNLCKSAMAVKEYRHWYRSPRVGADDCTAEAIRKGAMDAPLCMIKTPRSLVVVALASAAQWLLHVLAAACPASPATQRLSSTGYCAVGSKR